MVTYFCVLIELLPSLHVIMQCKKVMKYFLAKWMETNNFTFDAAVWGIVNEAIKVINRNEQNYCVKNIIQTITEHLTPDMTIIWTACFIVYGIIEKNKIRYYHTQHEHEGQASIFNHQLIITLSECQMRKQQNT